MNFCFPKNVLQKAILMSSLLLNNAFADAQTTLISPTGTGGFELGNTFAANGWSVANDAIDGWALGNAPTGASGARAAYISSDNGTTWAYSQTSKIIHLFKDVTIPAGETSVRLSFKWKANGDGVSGLDNDNLKVFFQPLAAGSIIQGTQLSSTYQIGGSGSNFNMYKLNAANYNSEYISFFAAAGTYRLIFSWKSDATAPIAAHQPPAAIDDVSLISATPSTMTSTALGGLWSSPQTWVGGVIPGGGDNVVIAAGANVVVDSRLTLGDLTIAGMLHWNATNNPMTIIRDVLIQNTGVFNPFTNTPAGLALYIGGHFTNNGTTNLALSSIYLNGSAQNSRLTQNFSGTGTFIGTGTSGIIRSFLPQTTGDVVVNTTQNLIVTGAFLPTGGTLNTNGKITLDNTASVYGQPFNQELAQIVLTNMGAGYTSQPTVTIGAPSGAGTTATAVANYDAASGTVRSITITNAGSGYRAVPNVVISNGGTPTIEATAVGNVFGSIAGPTVVTGYKSPATITGGLNIVNGQRLGSISAFNSATTNMGYTSVPEVGFSLPTNMLNLVTAGGTGYTSAPTVVVSGGTQLTGGTAPSFTPVVAQGKVVSVLCSGGGSLWTSLPTLTLTGGGGTGAEAAFPANCLPTATAIVRNEMVSDFTITNAGFGYTSTPAAGLVGGGGTAPQVICRVGNYNLSCSSTTTSLAMEDALIPNHRRIGQITMSNLAGMQFAGDLELYGINGILLFQGVIHMGATGNHTLNCTHPSYAGTNNTVNSFVNGTIKLAALGGATTRTFPFETQLLINTGTGTGATGSTVTQLTARYTPVPSGAVTPTGVVTGVRGYNVLANTGAIYGTDAAVTMNFNANDGIIADNPTLFIGQAAANTGAWTTQSVAAAAGVLPATGTRSTITGAPQNGISPIVMTGNDYFAWLTTFDFNGSVASGNWDAAATWSKGHAPTCTELAVINPNHTVAVNAAGQNAKSLTINPLSRLTVATGGELTVGCTANNNPFNLKGTLDVQGGTLNVNGNIDASSISTFTQSGGNINVDGNNNGVIATSVATTTPIIHLRPSVVSSVNWTGGTLTIIDPHASATATDVLKVTGTLQGAVNTTVGHTIRFGNGVSTDAGGNVIGFATTLNASYPYLPYGNVIVEGATGTNRNFTPSIQYIRGNWTMNNGSVVTMTTQMNLKGDLLVNAGAIFNNTTTLSLTDFTFSTTGVTLVPTPNAQSLTNLGILRYSAALPTLNLYGLSVNNGHANGVTFNNPLSMYGLILMAGKVNTTATNTLTLGLDGYESILIGGSSTAYINGPMIRNFLVRGAGRPFDQTVLFPIGKDTNYSPIYLNPVTTAANLRLRAEAFMTNTGTFGNPFINLASRRWEVTKELNGSYMTQIGVRESDTARITAAKEIVQATSANGVYAAITPVSTFATGTLTTATPLMAADFTGFLSYGERCQTPNTPTALAQSFCGAKTVADLAATPMTGGTIQWYATMASITPLASADAITTNTYYVTQTVAGGCTSVRLPVAVAVNSFPLSTINTFTSTNFCQGNNVVLNANTGSGLTYQWNQNGTPIVNATGAYHVVTASGLFTLNTTNSDGCSTVSAPTTVTVSPIPTPALSVNGNTTLCQGDSAQLIVTGGTTYLWSNGRTDTAIWVKNAGYYTVTVTNGGNCSAATSQLIVVNPIPAASIAAGGATTFCQGDNVTLNANAGTGLSYQWTKNGTSLLGETNPTYTTNTAGVYQVVVRGSNGCTNTAATTVVVKTIPIPVLSTTGSATMCQGDSVQLRIRGGASYVWSNNLTDTSFWTKANGTYAVTVTSDSGCTAVTSKQVIVNALPTATITANGSTTFCQGGDVTLVANAGTRLTYQWVKDSIVIGNATNRTYGTLRAGAFAAVVTDSNGCKNTSSVINVVVNSNPNVSFTNSLQAGSGSIIDFTNTSSTGTAQWFFGDSLNSTSTQLNPSFWYKKNGLYSVKLVVTNANGCSDSTSVMITVTGVRTDVSDLVEPLKINVFPNPVTDWMTVKIENTTVHFGNNDRLIVTNGLGQTVHQAVLNQKITELDTQNWSEGIYNLTIYSNGQMIPVKKVVKVNR
jgi:Ig-like domain CHU_C associated/PKD domain/Secretion system C-terminal sorting domain